MGSYSRRLSRTQRRWSTRHQIDMAWLAAPGRPQRDVAIHGDDLCATSVITPCVQSANLRGTHSFVRRGIHSANSFTTSMTAGISFQMDTFMFLLLVVAG